MARTCPKFVTGSGRVSSNDGLGKDKLKTHHFYSRPLPEPLESLNEIASDLRWTWSHASDALWKRMDPKTWDRTRNPYLVLQNLSQTRLDELAEDQSFLKKVHKLEKERADYIKDQNRWFSVCYSDSPLKGVAYLSLEFGLGEALPMYAGGLGILAGDYLKAVSDLGLPVVGIGLLYQEGYFRQSLDEHGWQQDVYPYNDPTNLPVTPLYTDEGLWMHVLVELPGRQVRLRVWQAHVGRVHLYLLDSNDPLNRPADRGITGKLYGGGQEMRLVQEIALGIGGWRLIESLGLDIDVCHLNEGHAAFVTLERARSYQMQHGIGFWEALWATRPGNVFTTHTPVPAGFDTFDLDLVFKYGHRFAESVGVDPMEMAKLGWIDANDNDSPFNMAYLALNTCGVTNGVSRLHGQVSRRIFQPLFPNWPQNEVPVTHITNGVHVPSWDSEWADTLWTEAAGKDRWLGDMETLEEAINELDDATLWEFLAHQRSDLIDYARRRLAAQLGQRDEVAQSIARAESVLDPNTLTLGFARRFAEYKRPQLLLQDEARLIRILTDHDQPVQLIVAGKAHPQDEIGKKILQQWSEFVKKPAVRAHVVFLEDYDIALAQKMVHGVDLWLNNPRRPWEACGTSGMKVLANGGLNFSQLDGWWAEAYDPDVGWALGDATDQHGGESDGEDGTRLYELLENEIVPAFYQRDEQGIPQRWVRMVRASMSRLTPQFSTNRMVREYVEKLYLPMAVRYDQRTSEPEVAKQLYEWEQNLRRHWYELHWGNINIEQSDGGWSFETQIYLGEIGPEAIQVQVYAEGEQEGIPMVMEQLQPIKGSFNGYLYGCTIQTERPVRDYTLRIIPYHPLAIIPTELNLICWQPRSSTRSEAVYEAAIETVA